jgi:hypothetical protein
MPLEKDYTWIKYPLQTASIYSPSANPYAIASTGNSSIVFSTFYNEHIIRNGHVWYIKINKMPTVNGGYIWY